MKQWFTKKKITISVCTLVIVLAITATVALLLNNKQPVDDDSDASRQFTFFQSETKMLDNHNDIGVMILDCDSDSCYKTLTNATVTQRTGKYVQGTGAFQITSMLQATNTRVYFEEKDISDYEKSGSIHISLYVSNPKFFGGSPLYIEMSSAGIHDKDEMSWKVPASVLQSGWNELYLGFDDTYVTGEPNLEAMNYLRMYTTTAKVGLDVIVDCVYATNTAPMSLEEDTSNMKTASTKDGFLMDCDTLDGIYGESTADHSLSTAKGEYKEGEGAIIVSNPKSVWLRANLKPIDISTYADGSISYWVYVNDASYLKNAKVYLEISSSGTFDKNEMNWNFLGSELKTGWNEVVLNLADGKQTKTGIDLTKVNFLRMYSIGADENLLLIIDAVKINPPVIHVPSDGMLLDCDMADSMTVTTKNAFSITNAAGEYKEGSGAFKSVGANTDWWKVRLLELVDVSKFEDGGLHLWLYVSDPSQIKTNVYIELGSGGTADVDEYQWTVAGLKAGWNELNLRFTKAKVTGNPELKKINYFRIYGACNGTITAMLDDVRATEIKPKAMIPGVILDCDSIENLSSSGGFAVTDAVDEYKEGSGAFKSVGASTSMDRFKVVLDTPVDLSAYKDGAVYFWLYIGDKSEFTSSKITIELTSAGKPDANELNWTILLSELKSNSWNEVKLNFADAAVKGDAIDLSAVNFFRIYADAKETNENVVMILDHVHAVKTPYVEEVIPGMIWACDNMKNVSLKSYSTYSFTDVEKEHTQGSAAFKTTGVTENGKVRLLLALTEPVDISAYAGGSLQFDLYIEDLSLFNSERFEVELTSSGKADVNELNWKVEFADLKEGWNTITLNFANANPKGDAIDFSAVNFFRIHFNAEETNENIVMIIDNIHAGDAIAEDDGNEEDITEEPGVILSCDHQKNMSVTSSNTNTISITTAEQDVKNGEGAYKCVGSGATLWSVVRDNAVDISEYSEGGVHVWFYVNDRTKITNVYFELGSTGTADEYEYQWKIPAESLPKDGWNELYLEFKDENKSADGGADLSSVKRFRAYVSGCSGEVTTMLDDVYAMIPENTSTSLEILSCDTKEGLSSINAAITVTTDGDRTVFRREGTTDVKFAAKLNTAVDISSYKEGSLQLDLYINDLTKLGTADKLLVQLSSTGSATSATTYQLNKNDIREGWNTYTLAFEDFGTSTNLDFTAVNYIRIYFGFPSGTASADKVTDAECVMMLDNVCAIVAEELPTSLGILSCDTKEGLSSINAAITVATDGDRTVFRREGTTDVKFAAKLNTAVDLSSYKDGNLQLDLYINDLTKLGTADKLLVQLSSTGSATSATTYQLNKNDLREGWNTYTLAFEDFGTLTNLDFTAVNYIRIYFGFPSGTASADKVTDAECVMMLDNICAIVTTE